MNDHPFKALPMEVLHGTPIPDPRDAEIASLRAELSKAIDRHESDSAMLAAASDVCERKNREIERLKARVDAAERARDAATALLGYADGFRFEEFSLSFSGRMVSDGGAWYRDDTDEKIGDDLPSALRALRDAGLLPDELAKVIE